MAFQGCWLFASWLVWWFHVPLFLYFKIFFPASAENILERTLIGRRADTVGTFLDFPMSPLPESVNQRHVRQHSCASECETNAGPKERCNTLGNHVERTTCPSYSALTFTHVQLVSKTRSPLTCYQRLLLTNRHALSAASVNHVCRPPPSLYPGELPNHYCEKATTPGEGFGDNSPSSIRFHFARELGRMQRNCFVAS